MSSHNVNFGSEQIKNRYTKEFPKCIDPLFFSEDDDDMVNIQEFLSEDKYNFVIEVEGKIMCGNKRDDLTRRKIKNTNLVLLCNQAVSGYNITDANTISAEPYLRMESIGLGGIIQPLVSYINIFQVMVNSEDQIFFLHRLLDKFGNPLSSISTVSLDIFQNRASLVSGAHCQPEGSYPIYGVYSVTNPEDYNPDVPFNEQTLSVARTIPRGGVLYNYTHTNVLRKLIDQRLDLQPDERIPVYWPTDWSSLVYGSAEPDYGMEGEYPKSNWFNDKENGQYILTNDLDDNAEQELIKEYLRERFLLKNDAVDKISIDDVRETLEKQTKTFTQPGIEEFISELQETYRNSGLESDSGSNSSLDSDSILNQALDDSSLNLSASINVVPEVDLDFHRDDKYITTLDKHTLSHWTNDPVDISDFFSTYLTTPYNAVYIKQAIDDDSGTISNVNTILFSKNMPFSRSDNVQSVPFSSEDDKEEWKRMMIERYKDLPGVANNTQFYLLDNDVTVFLPTEEIPIDDMENVMSYRTIDGDRKFIQKDGLRSIVIFAFKVERIPQEDIALNPRRLDFGPMSDDDDDSSSNMSEYDSDMDDLMDESDNETDAEEDSYSLYPYTYDYNYRNIDYVRSNIPAYVRILYNELSTNTFFNSGENILNNFTSFKFIMDNLLVLRSIMDSLDDIDNADEVEEVINLVEEAEQDIVDAEEIQGSEDDILNRMEYILVSLLIRIGFDRESNRFVRPASNQAMMTGGGNKLSRFTLDGKKYLYDESNGSIYNLDKSGRKCLGYVKNNKFIAN